MPASVCSGARLQCSKGVGESKLVVRAHFTSHDGTKPMATIEDCVPLVNYAPFQGCTAEMNPQQAAPGGPKPCVPQVTQPWSDEIDFITLERKKLIERRATLTCMYGGTISIIHVGQDGAHVDTNMLRFPDPFGTTGKQK